MHPLEMRANIDEELLAALIPILRARHNIITEDARAIATLLYAAAVVSADLRGQNFEVDSVGFLQLAEQAFKAALEHRLSKEARRSDDK